MKLDKPIQEWTSSEIAAYVVNCDNVGEIAEMIEVFGQNYQKVLGRDMSGPPYRLVDFDENKDPE